MYRQEDSYEVRYLASAVAERLRGRSASPSADALASAVAERLRGRSASPSADALASVRSPVRSRSVCGDGVRRRRRMRSPVRSRSVCGIRLVTNFRCMKRLPRNQTRERSPSRGAKMRKVAKKSDRHESDRPRPICSAIERA